MSTENKGESQAKIRMKAFEISQSAAGNTEQARKVIEEAVRKIPDSELKNFRSGQILIIR